MSYMEQDGSHQQQIHAPTTPNIKAHMDSLLASIETGNMGGGVQHQAAQPVMCFTPKGMRAAANMYHMAQHQTTTQFVDTECSWPLEQKSRYSKMRRALVLALHQITRERMPSCAVPHTRQHNFAQSP